MSTVTGSPPRSVERPVQAAIRPIIGALNEYLHAYHMYRAEALSVPEIVKLDTKSREALDKLQRVFPYFVTLAGGRQRSAACGTGAQKPLG